jgi:uncharacterized pyridoxamine 5'-phosphate oxidase family protein
MSSNNERIVRILRQAGVFYFATIDGDQPSVRPFNAVMEYEGKVYFYTNNHKNAFKQMRLNPKIEICTSIGDDRWIRINGKAIFDYRPEVKKAMIEENPDLKKIYSVDDKIFEVFYLSNMSAKIHSVNDSPEIIC